MNRRPGNRVAWAGAWSRGHNNARYTELLPRLENVDRYFVDMHPFWPIRGVRRRMWLPLLVRWIGRRYPLVLCTDWRQIRWVRNRVVCDHDDPLFSAQELAALSRPNVAAVIVTSEGVRDRLVGLGLAKPVRVITQGIVLPNVPRERVAAIRSEGLRSPDEIVVGLHQPHFEFSEELQPGTLDQMYAVDVLFEAVQLARKSDPRLVLWLVGEPSRRVREYAAERPWVRLVGYKPHADLPDYVSAFDIGVYPRSMDLMGRASIKVLEYMACGVPVVGFDVEEMRPVREGNAGVVVRDVPSFATALISLAGNEKERRRVGDRGRKAAGLYDWDLLSARYRAFLDGLAAS